MEARGLFRDRRWLGSEVNHGTEAALKAILATRRRTVDHHLGIRSQNPAADLLNSTETGGRRSQIFCAKAGAQSNFFPWKKMQSMVRS